jgi:hypothetical protein
MSNLIFYTDQLQRLQHSTDSIELLQEIYARERAYLDVTSGIISKAERIERDIMLTKVQLLIAQMENLRLRSR